MKHRIENLCDECYGVRDIDHRLRRSSRRTRGARQACEQHSALTLRKRNRRSRRRRTGPAIPRRGTTSRPSIAAGATTWHLGALGARLR